MDNSIHFNRMLQFIDRPGFLVKDQQILYVNALAEAYNIKPGNNLFLLLRDALPAYEVFTEGKLCVTIHTDVHALLATVEKIDSYDLFLLEPAEGTKELRALALASMQLRDPLSGLMNAIDEGNQQAKHMVSRLHRMINNMSDASRYRNFRKPKMYAREVSGFIASIIDNAAAKVEALGATLQFTGLSSPLYMQVDEELLERAILNMISNSLKATAKLVQFSLTKRDKMLYLTVQDDGRGVSEKAQGQIFDSYRREPSLNDIDYGLGLGMVIIQAAAAAHQGTVLLEHRKEQGLRLTMTLSIVQKTDILRTPTIKFDYNGYADHTLTELSDVLPDSEY